MEDRLAQAHRLELEGKLEQAAACYEALLETELPTREEAVLRKHVGNLHFRLGHLRSACAHLSRACEIDPDNGALWHDRGVVEYHMADFDEAVASLERALGHESGFEVANFWLGNALYHRGDLDQAATAFGRLLDRFPNFTIARFHLGVIYARQGRREDAEAEFRRVLSKNPEDAAAGFYVEPRSEDGRSST